MAVQPVPFDAFVALLSATTGVEITGGNYAREPASFEYTADGITIANLAAIQWDIAALDWGTIGSVELWDAVTGGNLLTTALPTAIALDVTQYAIARIPPAGIQMVARGAPRTFGTGPWGVDRFMTTSVIVPVGSGIGSPYSLGGYGVGPYETLPFGVALQITFNPVALCSHGTWAPVGPFGLAA
jgi:hypothetical protein